VPEAPEEAGLDIDFDAELARIQATVAGIDHPVARQIAVAGQVVMSDRTIEFMGKRFRIADKIGLMPLLKFSAFSDVAVQDPRALGALYAMLRDCIHAGNPGCGECGFCAPERCGGCPNCRMVAAGEDGDGLPCTVNRADPSGCRDYDPGDWHAFEDHACESKAEADDLMDVVTKTIEIVAGRPTAPPSPSSAGRQSTRDASMARSSARRGRGSKR
jgi:hypothetical protein